MEGKNKEIHDAVNKLENVPWNDTNFQDLQWYCAEDNLYLLRCKHGEPNERLCIVRAGSLDEAITRGVFGVSPDKQSKSKTR